MNVMEIVSGTGVNGAIRHCWLLSTALVRRGHGVTLVCNPDSWIASQAAGCGIEVIPSDLHRWPIDELRRIVGAAAGRRIDVIHTHMSRAHFFGVLLRWLSGVPCVATAHNRHLQLHWMFNDLVIAVSEATRRFHRRANLVSRRRLVTIHNFVDQDRIIPADQESRRRMRRSLGIGEQSPLVGTVADVIPDKGYPYLVQAVPRILAAVPQARFVFVGGQNRLPDYVARIKATAERLGVAAKILWTGHRSDIPDLLAAFDLFVAASVEESFGLAILEAMAAGLPVVATAAGGIPEVVRHGETGILVAPAQSDALADAVIRLLSDPALARRFGESGRRRVLTDFALEAQAARIEAALASVARRARSA
jgi:glycosyltransferase involved in cell wall biosynthesis